MQAVIQTPTFIADCRSAGLSDDEVAVIVAAIAADPLAGDVMKGTGGARKLRFAGKGKGKSGGYRTVSYFAGSDVPVLILALINKGERDNLSKAERNELAAVLASYAVTYRLSVKRRVAELRKRGLL